MKKHMVMIRNITGITPDEIESVVEMAGLRDPTTPLPPDAPADIVALQRLRGERDKLQQDKAREKQELNEQIRGLLQKIESRDYLYERIKANTGNQIILHLDHDISSGEDAEAYIVSKLATIPQGQNVNLFYMGGGHGGGREGRVDDETSGLKKASVQKIVGILQSKNIHMDAAIFGSCYSAAFANDFRGFLTDDGVMLSDSVECSDNNFLPTMRWAQHADNSPFFSQQETDDAQMRLSVLRDKFQEESGERIDDDQIVGNYAADLAAVGSAATLLQLKAITANHPVIQQHIIALEGNSVFRDDIERLSPLVCQMLKDYDAQHPAAPIDDAYAELDQQFPDPCDKRVLAVFKAMNKEYQCADTVDQVLSDFDMYKEGVLDNGLQGLTGMADMKLFQNEEGLYKAIQASMQREAVTGRVVSTKDSSHLLQLSENTGKPAACCRDAIKLSERTIDILSRPPTVTVTAEKDLSCFNERVVMTEFNDGFVSAMQAAIAREQVFMKQSIQAIKGSNPPDPTSTPQTGNFSTP